MIRLLDDSTISKIAAGEIIENSASIVKELVENSIDAGADDILVEIRGESTNFIKVSDNGSGFSEEDLNLAFLRHSTSKLEKIEDLEKLRTLGFRGEALASISNISKINSNFPKNVVPDCVEFSGEIRGHDEKHVLEILEEYEKIVREFAEDYEFEKSLDYPALRPTDMDFSKDILKSYKNVGVDAKEVVIGGGSDANFFAEEGFNSLIIGVGMEKVHTKEEYIVLDDLIKTTKALIDYLEIN